MRSDSYLETDLIWSSQSANLLGKLLLIILLVVIKRASWVFQTWFVWINSSKRESYIYELCFYFMRPVLISKIIVVVVKSLGSSNKDLNVLCIENFLWPVHIWLLCFFKFLPILKFCVTVCGFFCGTQRSKLQKYVQ